MAKESKWDIAKEAFKRVTESDETRRRRERHEAQKKSEQEWRGKLAGGNDRGMYGP